VGGCLEISAIGVALFEVKRDLVKRALFPLFRFGQPENSALGIQQRPLSAYKFLVANFDELVHELHSCGVKPIYTRVISELGTRVFQFALESGNVCRYDVAGIAVQHSGRDVHHGHRTDGHPGTKAVSPS
jgi:hypothetical protein